MTRKSGRELLMEATSALTMEIYLRHQTGEDLSEIAESLNLPACVVDDYYCQALEMRRELLARLMQ